MGAGGGGGGGGGGAGAGGVGGTGAPAPTGVSSGGGGTLNIDTSGFGRTATRATGFYNTSRKAAAASSMPVRSLIEPINSYIQATRGLT